MSSNPTYLMFLSDKYFDVGCLGKKSKLPEILRSKGIHVLPIDRARGARRYNDFLIPELNVLYIHIINGDYYSDDTYNKKKRAKERDILFLLAAKLGVEKISYETEITETNITLVDSAMTTSYFRNGITFTKKRHTKEGQTGNETYLNRGAPVYTLSTNLSQVESNIRQKFDELNSKIFHDFYENNPNLRTFVYKRFNFKILSVEYTTEDEDISEKTFEIRSILLSYGIGLKFDKIVSISERVRYSMNFFTDKDLRIKLNEIIRLKEDKFAGVRELYNSESDKQLGIYRIIEYVKKYAKSVAYYSQLDSKKQVKNCYDLLNTWINNNKTDEFEEICKKFTSSYQIRNWLVNTLCSDSDIIIPPDGNHDQEQEQGGVLSLKQRDQNNSQYARSLSDSLPYNREQELRHRQLRERETRERREAQERHLDSDRAHGRLRRHMRGGRRQHNRKLHVEKKISANFKGRGRWYDAKIISVNSDGTYDIRYDDGDLETRVPRQNIKLNDDNYSSDGTCPPQSDGYCSSPRTVAPPISRTTAPTVPRIPAPTVPYVGRSHLPKSLELINNDESITATDNVIVDEDEYGF